MERGVSFSPSQLISQQSRLEAEQELGGYLFRKPPTYRIWLYGYCTVMLPFLCGSAVSMYYFCHLDWMNLFPFEPVDPHWIYVYISISIQMLDLILGIYGVSTDRIACLYFFWVLFLIMIAADLTYAVVSTFWWSNVISTLDDKLIYYMDKRNHSTSDKIKSDEMGNFCKRWSEVQSGLFCCGVERPSDYATMEFACQSLINGSLPASCCPSKFKHCTKEYSYKFGCVRPLLEWMNDKRDFYLSLSTYLVLCLRVVGLIILRHEIRQLINEIHTRKIMKNNIHRKNFSIDYLPLTNSGRMSNNSSVSTPLME
ncbi:hypothetical protein T4A_1186 [Trichinella pseudospiralis]|uniref:Tetraspanin-1 n=1 Tax=Trichinella pseudospiralis TaxID=6337 RepID=A0A0V1EC86_TRIPS|nr:hypothetical protein T4A_1186 [Trichinella pseudospiralis]KRZ44838.1 hypothetical protein T4C_8095 [Trichinella pseudospiralis]